MMNSYIYRVWADDEPVVISACLDHGPTLYLKDVVTAAPRLRSGMALDVDWQQRRICTGSSHGFLELWSFSKKDLKENAFEIVFQRHFATNGSGVRALAALWKTDGAF